MADIRQRYSVPTREAYAEVSLSEFTTDEIRAYLAYVDKKPGYENPNMDDSLTFDANEMSHIGTLLLCGQHDAAKEIILNKFSNALGRPIK